MVAAGSDFRRRNITARNCGEISGEKRRAAKKIPGIFLTARYIKPETIDNLRPWVKGPQLAARD